jgi:hypothetical protein
VEDYCWAITGREGDRAATNQVSVGWNLIENGFPCVYVQGNYQRQKFPWGFLFFQFDMEAKNHSHYY